MDKCRRRRHKACCGEDLMEDLHSNDTIRRECFRESFEKDKGSRGPPPDPFKCDSNMIGRHRMKMMVRFTFTVQYGFLVQKLILTTILGVFFRYTLIIFGSI